MTMLYSLLRFVPDPARAESINIGLVIGDRQNGDVRLLLDLGSRRRAHVLADRRTVDSVWSYIHDLKSGIEHHRGEWRDFRFTGEWLQERHDTASNLIQFTSPTPAMGRDIDEVAATLSEQLLRAPAALYRDRRFNKSTLLKEVRRAYRSAGIEQTHLFEKAVVAGSHHQETFDFAVANGKAVQLAQAWNFRQENLELLAEAVKAWAWTVRDIREKGGEATVEEKTVPVPKNVVISAVYAPPNTAQGRELLGEARHAFRSVKAVPVTEKQISRVANRAVKLLEPHRAAAKV